MTQVLIGSIALTTIALTVIGVLGYIIFRNSQEEKNESDWAEGLNALDSASGSQDIPRTFGRKVEPKQLCYIDLETSGLKAGFNEVMEICIYPITQNLEPVIDCEPFIARVMCLKPENAHPKALEINGLNPNEGEFGVTVCNDFLNWMADNGIDKIIPIAHNWSFDKSFLQEFFGNEYERLFYHRAEDTQRVAAGIDRAHLLKYGKNKFPGISLQKLAEYYEIPYDCRSHTALGDCEVGIEVYKKLLKEF